MSTEKFNVIYHDYPEYFTISKSQKPQFNIAPSKVSKEIQARIDSKELSYKLINGSLLIVDAVTQEAVVTNTAAAGNVTQKKINAQMLWSAGPGSNWDRNKLKKFLSGWFLPGLIRQNFPERLYLPKDHFIQMEYIFFYNFENKKTWHGYQDYLNHAFIYAKTFEDVLVNNHYLPDDGPKYMRGGYARYVDINGNENDQRRLEIKIHFCKNHERIS
jgi:hypothetical protein